MSQVTLVPVFPLAGAVILLLFGKRLRTIAGVLATLLVGASFVTVITVVSDLAKLPSSQRVVVHTAYTWILTAGFKVAAAFRIDPLTCVMLIVITGVGSLIHWYAIGYMAHDPRKGRFFSYLNLFVFSMLILVLADNFLLMFVGWELVGLCSYLLVSFWYEKPSAAAAGKKAFITTRIGDLGFIIGLFAIYKVYGSLDFATVFGAATKSAAPAHWATAIPLLLFCGAVGKSAQIPLYVWLPDAMEGPTPVSALIHAATMVTAGVYLVARAHVLFENSHAAAVIVAAIGVATAFFAATIALTEDDIKRVLAYSTISQLGYMFVGVGVGALYRSADAYASGIFHLMTHAFFKALLFLAAGSVMHAMHDRTDMKQMGGLIKKMPITGTTFIVGGLALAGIFPFAGFWSKDAILGQAYVRADYVLWAVGLAAAILTAFYVGRQIFMTFFGRSRVPAEIHPHEAPSSMTIPLIALAILATIGGFIGIGEASSKFYTWLSPVFTEPRSTTVASPAAWLSVLAVALALVSLAFAWRYYLQPGYQERRTRLTSHLVWLRTVLKHKWYVDEAYGFLFVRPALAMAKLAAGFDRYVIDGAVMGVAHGIGFGARYLREIQTGFVRRYVMTMFGGAVLVVAVLIVRAAH
ncbi:MAG TPA: NADH-quinone oxidoreductase subunit L [Actinomycetota bacterium]|nr:NADH-quinone oxidoreductase subunit L [Actinomycetota bacterium]